MRVQEVVKGPDDHGVGSECLRHLGIEVTIARAPKQDAVAHISKIDVPAIVMIRPVQGQAFDRPGDEHVIARAADVEVREQLCGEGIGGDDDLMRTDGHGQFAIKPRAVPALLDLPDVGPCPQVSAGCRIHCAQRLDHLAGM